LHTACGKHHVDVAAKRAAQCLTSLEGV